MGEEAENSSSIAKGSVLKVALAGNPNSGKTTLFNALTGLNQKVGNFPGVTVEKKSGLISLDSAKGKVSVELTDLPGAYSIYPKSMDERVQCDILINRSHRDHPDLIVYVADASNLKRSLFLCTQLIDLEVPLVLALNMMDLVDKEGAKIEHLTLAEELGVPVVLMNARGNMGFTELKAEILKNRSQTHKHFIDEAEIETEVIQEIQEVTGEKEVYTAFQLASNYQLLSDEKAKAAIGGIVEKHHFNAMKYQRQETLARYKKINTLLSSVLKNGEGVPSRFTEKLDNILTHKVYGFLIFLGILFLVFQAIFSWSAYPMDLLEKFFIFLTVNLKANLPSGVLTDLLVDGVLAGLSGILVFIPQIALLFLFIAILEDTGYMARVSFIMDKMMRKFGLNGRSVIPLISGVACAVPAIMSARTISNWKERIITIMVTPLMSCSARLPVYTLLIALVVPAKKVLGFLSLQAIVMMGLYLIGFLAAIGAALVLKWIIKARERSYFIMELPIYRAPRWSSIGLTIVEKVKLFVFEAGKVIIAVSIVLWVLSSYGPPGKFKAIEERYLKEEVASKYTPEELQGHIQSEKLEASFAGIFGHAIEPVIRPLGFDWKIGIALITSFAAREVFVGTMATIYSAGDEENTSSIRDKMRAEINPKTGEKQYNLAVVFSLLIFYAFAMQCMSTLAIVYTETKSIKWPLIQFAYMSALAYLSSLIIYQVLS